MPAEAEDVMGQPESGIGAMFSGGGEVSPVPEPETAAPDDETKEMPALDEEPDSVEEPEAEPEAEVEVEADAEEVADDEDSGDGDEEEAEEPTEEEMAAFLALQRDGARAGLTEEQIAAFDTPEALGQAIAMKQAMAAAKQEEGQDAPVATAPLDIAVPELEAFEMPELDPEIYDEKMTGTIKAIAEHQHKVASEALSGIVSQVNQRNAAHAEANQQLAWQIFGNALDTCIGRLGEEWTDTLGASLYGELTEQQLANRTKIEDATRGFMAEAARAGQVMSMEKALGMAVQSTFKDKVEAKTRKKLVKKVTSNKRKKMGTPRPEKKKLRVEDGMAEAVERTNALLRKAGVDAGQDETAPVTSLPFQSAGS